MGVRIHLGLMYSVWHHLQAKNHLLVSKILIPLILYGKCTCKPHGQLFFPYVRHFANGNP